MFRFVLERLGVFSLCTVLASCGGGGSTQTQTGPPPPNSQISVPRSGITHLMIVVMQNVIEVFDRNTIQGAP